MSKAETQGRSNHRRFVPLYHFLALPILLVNLVWVAVDVFQAFSVRGVFEVAVAFSLLAVGLFARTFALAAQDRVIRLEERLRMREVLPEEMHQDIAKFSTGQLVGLRFASDGELPDIARSTLDGDMSGEDAKKLIKKWRPDHQRV